jgi:hypothetical protein
MELISFKRKKATTMKTLHLFSAVLIPAVLLSACGTFNPATSTPQGVPLTPTVVEGSTAIPTQDGSFQIFLDTGHIATGFQTETIPAVSDSANAPYWEVLPEYTRVTLQGYPISSHLMQPQIFIYPVNDLVMTNEGAGTVVASLQALLQSPQEIQDMPFLPLLNAVKVMHSHVQYLDFKSGKGLRYLTQFNQGFVPINNYDLIYTYQGLTNDGKYYVAAVLPVNHPSLPADENVTGSEPIEFLSDNPTYLANVAQNLNAQAANTFTPDLTQLDAMMSSLEIK